jgi:hypothetical protein
MGIVLPPPTSLKEPMEEPEGALRTQTTSPASTDPAHFRRTGKGSLIEVDCPVPYSPGWGTAMTVSPSMPVKSLGLHVCMGKSFEMAMAAIIASYALAAGLRPTFRSPAATLPKLRAAAASNGRGSKSASACWRCAWRAMRSSSVVATSGPTESSASVTVVICGSSGKASVLLMRPSRMRVLVSRMPRVTTSHAGVENLVEILAEVRGIEVR